MINALTIDVEDYYSIALRDHFALDTAPSHAVVRNTNRILELLEQRGVKGTFFILGEVAQTHPGLVRDIAEQGHEIGVHGLYHRQLFKLSPDEFRSELSDAKKLIEDCAGQSAPGYRAPAFSVGPDTQWGLEIIAELGFRYDGSVFPFKGKRYGWGGFNEDIHEMTLPSGATIIEAPMSVVRIFGKALPACGGGYLRYFPYAYTRWAMRRIQRVRPGIVYVHPYELDLEGFPEDFKKTLSTASLRLRLANAFQLLNRKTVMSKLVRLLEDFSFAPLGQVIDWVLEKESAL